jgi:hypothetical protein
MKKHTIYFSSLVVIFVFVALVLAFSQAGLPGAINKTISNARGGGVGESFALNAKMMATDSAVGAPMSAIAPVSNSPTSVPRKITKTGNLSILVDTAESAVQNIQTIAESVAGYVSNSNLYEVTPGVKAGSITIRVPADKFDQTMTRVKELALKVENENVNANDVTDQFIDLEARLKNLQAQEVQYLAILKKAQKVEDIVNVTNQLNQVRQQIDSWQGQLKYLNSQVELSSITVNLTAEKEVQIFGLNWRPLTVIKQAFRSLLDSLVSYANLIIAVLIFLPVIALWIVTVLIVIWIGWKIVKRVKKGPANNPSVKKTPAKTIARKKGQTSV